MGAEHEFAAPIVGTPQEFKFVGQQAQALCRASYDPPLPIVRTGARAFYLDVAVEELLYPSSAVIGG